jgi:glycosyltransferase involved in cell wall biosynthesis
MPPQHPLKLLFLTSSYPRGEHDVASVFLRYFAEALAVQGNEVHVLAPADGKSTREIEGRITVHRFQYFPLRWQKLAYGSGIVPNLSRSPWLWIQVPFFLLAMTWSFLRLLAAQRFDLVHAHWLLPQGLVGLVGARLFRLPLVVTVHGTDAFALRSKFATWLKNIVLLNSSAWSTNTVTTSAVLIADSAIKQPRIIPMGVDVVRFANGHRTALRRELPDDQSVVLFVGRLIAHKGCDDLIKAVSLLPEQRRSRTTLWVVGDGDQCEQLTRAAQGLGISEKIKFFGTVGHDQLPDYYAAADIVVIPSKRGSSGETEGQGVVVLEAFAARVCVIATNIGGITSMVRDYTTGLLVEPSDPQKLSQAIERLLNEPELRKKITDNAFAEASVNFSWAHVAGEFEKLYSEVLKIPWQ